MADGFAITRIAKCLELTASNHDGEALAAARKANKLREMLGTTWTELIEGPRTVAQPVAGGPVPDPREMFETIRLFNPPRGKWRPVIESIEDFWTTRGYLTPKQQRLVEKFFATAMQRKPPGNPLHLARGVPRRAASQFSQPIGAI